ncbi:MAG: FHA domain-containing protein [Planctomycetota bacterium]
MKLVIAINGEVLAERDFAEDRRVGIGRAPNNEVVIDNNALSRHHAELERRDGVWRLRDLGSANGVFVNGAKVALRRLSDGDVIAVGKYSLSVTLSAAERHRALLSQREADPPLPTAHLVVHQGTGQPRLLPLHRDVLLVGSCRTAGLWIDSWRCPDRLALITRGLSGFTLVNLAGKGVYHNTRPLELRATLNEGDRLELDRLMATFHRGAAPRQRIARGLRPRSQAAAQRPRTSEAS